MIFYLWPWCVYAFIHDACIHDPWSWCMFAWCKYEWCIYPWSLTLMHVYMMHITMNLDPDACVYGAGMNDAYIHDLWPWCMYLWCGIFSGPTDQRTDEQGDSRSWMVEVFSDRLAERKPLVHYLISDCFWKRSMKRMTMLIWKLLIIEDGASSSKRSFLLSCQVSPSSGGHRVREGEANPQWSIGHPQTTNSTCYIHPSFRGFSSRFCHPQTTTSTGSTKVSRVFRVVFMMRRD